MNNVQQRAVNIIKRPIHIDVKYEHLGDLNISIKSNKKPGF